MSHLRICALLGTPPGKLKHMSENLPFIADFILSHHLLGKHCHQQRWTTQLGLHDMFEKLRDRTDMPASENLFLSGPSPSGERFEIPMEEPPLGLVPWYTEMPSGQSLMLDFLLFITKYAESASPEDQLLVLIFGRRDGTRVRCGAMDKEKPVWLELAQVDRMLKKSGTARVKVIPGACVSGAWHRLGLESCTADLITPLSDRRHLLPDPSEYEVHLSKASAFDDDSEEEDPFFFVHHEDDFSVENALPSIEEEQEEEVPALDEAELAELDAYTALWVEKMRPLGEVVNVSYYPMRGSVRRHQQRSLTNKHSAALLRVFRTRGAADDLAQELAEEAGIVHPGVHCRDFPAGNEPPPCQGLKCDRVRWGTALLPQDDCVVDSFERRYRRASEWLFHIWSQSDEPVSVLNKMLESVGGGVE